MADGPASLIQATVVVGETLGRQVLLDELVALHHEQRQVVGAVLGDDLDLGHLGGCGELTRPSTTARIAAIDAVASLRSMSAPRACCSAAPRRSIGSQSAVVGPAAVRAQATPAASSALPRPPRPRHHRSARIHRRPNVPPKAEPMTPPERLRALLAEPGFVVMPAVWDGLSAKLAAGAGFKTAFLSGSCVAASRLGGPDLDLDLVRGDVRLLQHGARRGATDAGAGRRRSRPRQRHERAAHGARLRPRRLPPPS